MTFEEWKNRPVYKTQVFTARMFFNEFPITSENKELILFRVKAEYRSEAIKKARVLLARKIKSLRKSGNFRLPAVPCD